jgi:hypothetical protein
VRFGEDCRMALGSLRFVHDLAINTSRDIFRERVGRVWGSELLFL